ncbi:MAG: AzlD domain-containing protein [Clostridia bacterium]|nr:AzlD domain-containing protein [Clostridia bacterium]
MNEILLLIFGMGLVTYLPRATPLIVLSGIKMPPFIKRVLNNIPFAALGALIFPGILSSTGDYFLGVAGGAAALILAYMELNLVIVVSGSIAVIYLLKVFIS